ncbi:MAG: cytochrome c oxidase assembly protein [Thermoleophilaceae bacterium]
MYAGAVIGIVLAEALYLRAVHVLGVRGYDVPFWQQVAWHGGVTLTAAGLLSPIDTLAEDLLSAHMAQHLLIADLAAPLLLVGMRSPVYAFLLPRPALVAVARKRRLRKAFRTLRRPLVAIPVFVALLYGWHIGFMFEGALNNDALHVLQHWSFVFGSVLVWWAPLDPKRRRLHGELWKIGHILGARLAGMMLGMAFLIMRTPAYDAYGNAAREHGLSPLGDQQIAGGMMLALDFLVMMFALSLFFWASARDADEAEAATRPVRA